MLHLVLALAPSLLAADPPHAPRQDEVRIQTTPIRGGVHMLVGQGGNLGLLVGDQGAFLIDDQFAPLSDAIRAAIAERTSHPVRFLVNTHWHGDHTGGNENFGKAGAILVAHENVRERMSSEQFTEAFERTVPPSPEAALPVVTFSDRVTFHWNGDEVRVFHVENAHTDGDSIIHFVGANVVHMGDTFFNGNYPFIDASSGGSLEGVIAAAERVLAFADDETRIIPGHGPLGTRAELARYHDVLDEIRHRIRDLLEAGMTLDEVVEARPTQDWDADWGRGFMAPDVFVRIATKTLR